MVPLGSQVDAQAADFTPEDLDFGVDGQSNVGSASGEQSSLSRSKLLAQREKFGVGLHKPRIKACFAFNVIVTLWVGRPPSPAAASGRDLRRSCCSRG